MYYGDIKHVDVANGPGVRVSLFVSGCTHRCPGCFNPDTWDYTFGRLYTQETEDEILQHLRPSHIKGLSLLGGEPFDPLNQQPLLQLAQRTRAEFPEKTIWCYSGYLFEDLRDGKVGAHSAELLNTLDVLVDGRFILEQKSLNLRFRGSSNQRVLLVQQSLAAGQPVYWDETAPH